MRERGRATGRARERKIERPENEGRGDLARRADRPVLTRDTQPPPRGGRRDEENGRDRTRARRPRRVVARPIEERPRDVAPPEDARPAGTEAPPDSVARRRAPRGSRSPRTRRSGPT